MRSNINNAVTVFLFVHLLIQRIIHPTSNNPQACTEHDVAVMIAVGSVDRSMGEATVGWMLSMTHNIAQKHALVVEGRWNDRSGLMGVEIRDRTFGAVGTKVLLWWWLLWVVVGCCCCCGFLVIDVVVVWLW